MKPLLPFFLLFISLSALAQKVEYTADFVFKNGIYLSFQDFKNNNPVPVTHILSDFDIRSADYLWEALDTDSIIYYDNQLEERKVAVNKVWGFCSNNRIHVGINTVERSDDWEDRDWFPLISIGAYSYFTALVSVTRFMPPSVGIGMPATGISLYDDPMMNNQGNYYQESVPIQMLLDFSNGEFIQLATGDLNSISPKLMADLLQKDQVLLAEYTDKSGRDQKQTSMFNIRKFNQRNPIYFPVSN
ncbi:MAG: hypothetical protein K9G41_01340 [Flavobacteriales bacterium]|nr:hypothetical protein [Flavobacteriales bacterium]